MWNLSRARSVLGIVALVHFLPELYMKMRKSTASAYEQSGRGTRSLSPGDFTDRPSSSVDSLQIQSAISQCWSQLQEKQEAQCGDGHELVGCLARKKEARSSSIHVAEYRAVLAQDCAVAWQRLLRVQHKVEVGCFCEVPSAHCKVGELFIGHLCGMVGLV